MTSRNIYSGKQSEKLKIFNGKGDAIALHDCG